MLDWTYETEALNQNKILCGTDEAGRGPLAGRVYAAAVVLDQNTKENEIFQTLNDSKKLSEKKRDMLAPKIKLLAKSSCIAYATVEEIEEINILSAALLAMKRAVEGLSLDRDSITQEVLDAKKLCGVYGEQITPDMILVDGNKCGGFDIPARSLVGGDGKCMSIAAASVLAKTERDKYCLEYLDKEFPEYNFAKHKGYGTKDHYAAVDEYGLCREHRPSFFKKYFEKKNNE